MRKLLGLLTLGLLVAFFLPRWTLLSRGDLPGSEPKLSGTQPIAPTPPSAKVPHLPQQQQAAPPAIPSDETLKILNQTSEDEKRSFVEAGWRLVQGTPPPDSKLLDLDPSYATTHPAALQAQIQSNSFAGPQLRKLRDIALTAQDPKTVTLALEALGRSDERIAQGLLIEILESPSQAVGNAAKTELALGYLKPQNPRDEMSDFLVGKINDLHATDDTREQAMFPLITMALAQSGSAGALDEVRNRLADDYRSRFDLLTTRLVGDDLTSSASRKRPSKSRVPAFNDSELSGGDGFLSLNHVDAWCKHPDGSACSPSSMESSHFKQVLIVPAGYTEADQTVFHKDFDQFVTMVSTAPAAVYSKRYSDRLTYSAYWIPGSPLGSDGVNFQASMDKNLLREGKTFVLNNQQVMEAVRDYRRRFNPGYDCFGVVVLYNSDEAFDSNGRATVMANAASASFLGNSFGIAKLSRGFLKSKYTPAHEMAHATLNWLDEYVNPGLENMSISSLDVLTPLLVMDGSWGGWVRSVDDFLGIYQYRVSEILASNGSDNVDVTPYPSRVKGPGQTSADYKYPGGMWFGKGTYHMAGKNLMNSDRDATATPGPADDGFAYDHSPAQKALVEEAFEDSHPIPRANDRIRNAGPLGNWRVKFGNSARVLIFDGDKNHEFHPTRQYDIEVGWYDRLWKACWKWKVIPYPCHVDTWTVAEKSVYPEKRSVQFTNNAGFGLAKFFQQVACGIGVKHLKVGGRDVQICEQSLSRIAATNLPTLVLPAPYQDAELPASQWLTQYFWHVRTRNSALESGWTGWSSFYRVL